MLLQYNEGGGFSKMSLILYVYACVCGYVNMHEQCTECCHTYRFSYKVRRCGPTSPDLNPNRVRATEFTELKREIHYMD